MDEIDKEILKLIGNPYSKISLNCISDYQTYKTSGNFPVNSIFKEIVMKIFGSYDTEKVERLIFKIHFLQDIFQKEFNKWHY